MMLRVAALNKTEPNFAGGHWAHGEKNSCDLSTEGVKENLYIMFTEVSLWRKQVFFASNNFKYA